MRSGNDMDYSACQSSGSLDALERCPLCPQARFFRGRHLVTAIGSFRSGSAGGLDGLSPQHLKDLTCPSAGEAGESLLKELTALTNLMLSGKVDETVIDVLYGANLCALRKKDGGIRPIAVGTTYRRMAAKICCKFYSEDVSEKFQPLQLGYGSKGGCEAAVHALSTYLNYGNGDVILKVDIKNAFNSVNRDTLLAEAKKEIPQIYSFLWQCYRHPTKLLYRDNLLESAVGCQQASNITDGEIYDFCYTETETY
nr:uncharacterized protein LOC126054131 [Helicoverpa armigera]